MLKYVGNGDALIGVPKRDLTAKEAEKYGKEKLISSGLYAEIKKAPAKKKVKNGR